ncbi:TonB-dependent receptor [Pseudohalioglobus sediminis]|uniref:TonB-dependent receptor n=2 Tax=Pseudohalioglobus sediminis TaxID=2606449 RepID=A0A5B0X4D8_9GAMM|nr:TonB-dependent receptor [Pseudohalioglobus sediminis]
MPGYGSLILFLFFHIQGMRTHRLNLSRLAPLLLLAAGSDVAASAQPAMLEEVIVVAQRVQQSAQDTPISLAALGRDQLDILGIDNIADIQANVPNFVVDSFPASNQTLRLFIRGIGITDVQVTQDPGVGVYLDGVYLARSSGLASEIADLERIEVLRGPQGTLYGRNTTGGALNLVTARPDTQAPGFTQWLGAGNRDQFHARSTLNLPLSSTQALKLAALYRQQEGYIDNPGPGGDFGDSRAEGYRLDWRWDASDTFTLDYSWDKSRVETHNYSPQAVLPGIESGTPADAAIRSSRRFVPYSRARMDRLRTSTPLLPTDTDISGHALTLDWDGQPLRIKSITAWRELEDASYIDFASGASAEYRVDFNAITLGASSPSPGAFDDVRTRLEQEQFSQELQLFSSLADSVQVVAGLYYFRETARENWFPLHHIFSFPLIETDDLGLAVNIRAEDSRIRNEAMAAYGQLTWSPAADWALTVGWRYSRDNREVQRVFTQDNYIDFGNLVLGPLESTDFRADADKDFDDNSFVLIAEHNWRDDTLLYAKLGEAYKSGGFNTRDPDPAFFSRGFDEEKNRTAEIGIKGEWLQRALRVNTAIFYSRFDDMQLNFLLPGTISDTRVLNTGKAELAGIELEVVAMPLYGLLLRGNYAYLHSEIDDVLDPFTGERRSFGFSNAPEHSASLNLDYQFPPVAAGVISVNLNYTYMDARDTASALTYIDAYDLLGARLTLSQVNLAGGEVSLSAWVKNALDEEYVTFTIDNLPHASRAVLWGEPRSWGIDLSYRY